MNRLALFLIKLYRRIPFAFPTNCIYLPSCSEYALEAFERYSFWHALKCVISRICKCHPFSKGGLDPVK